MKKLFLIILIPLSVVLGFNKAHAQTEEVQQLLLNVEKLAQLKQILQDMKRGYEVLSKGYTTIKNFSEGNFNLHQTFLDGLLEVSPAVKKYKRVTEIMSMQVSLVKEYKAAFYSLKESRQFTLEEIEYVGKVYSNLSKQSLDNLNTLVMVITSGTLRMSDDERLTAIDAAWQEVQDKLSFLRHFNNQNKMLALQRAKEKNNVQAVENLYGLKTSMA
jgi:hypothetical protein